MACAPRFRGHPRERSARPHPLRLVAPASLEGESLEIAREIDGALEEALRAEVSVDAAEAAPTQEARVPDATLGRLLGRARYLSGVAEGLEGLGELDQIDVRVGEDVVIGEEVQLDATLVVIDADLEIRGEVRGDVVLVGGELRLEEGSVVTGQLRLVDAELSMDPGSDVRGGIRRIEVDGGDRADAPVSRVTVRHDEDGAFAPVRGVTRAIGRGVGNVFEGLAVLLAVGLLGGVLVFFAGQKVEVIAEAARRDPARAGLVGAAGAFLTLPVWILGILGLTVSLIGIPVLVAWIPLFPVAVLLAAGLGYFAVAQNVGEWVARRRLPYLDWVRTSNPVTLVFGGVLTLMAAFLLADVLSILTMGPLRGFLEVVGVVVSVMAVLVGFGAVLLTRAGSRPDIWGRSNVSRRSASGRFDEWDVRPSPPSGPGAAPGTHGAGRRPGSGGDAGEGHRGDAGQGREEAREEDDARP